MQVCYCIFETRDARPYLLFFCSIRSNILLFSVFLFLMSSSMLTRPRSLGSGKLNDLDLSWSLILLTALSSYTMMFSSKIFWNILFMSPSKASSNFLCRAREW